MKDESTPTANNFDFLRLAFAILVIYSHSYPLGTGSEADEPLRLITHGQMTWGNLAVDLFFVMSGFMITASAERSRSILSYFKKRFARIYPAFVVNAVLTALLVMPIASASFNGSPLHSFGNFILQTLRLREFDYSHAFSANPYPGPINGSLWSIQYEFWCYTGVALLFVFGLLRRRWLVFWFFLAAVIAGVAVQATGWIRYGSVLGVIFGLPFIWARLLPLYLAGVVFYLFRDQIKLNKWGVIACVAALAAACWWHAGMAAVFPFAGTYLVFYIAFAKWLPLSKTGKFGDFSYGTYLYAFPIMQIVMLHIGHPVEPLVLFLYATPLTLAVAVASWYCVERRFLISVRRITVSPATMKG